MSAIAWIGIDWGTTSLRAWAFAQSGGVVARVEAPSGVAQIEPGGFEDALRAAIGDWLDAAPQAPMVACGMIGSSIGWREAPYLFCPAALDDLAANAIAVEMRCGRSIMVIPGLAQRGGAPVDAMRGEETQILGAMADAREAIVVLPGTHCKWARVEDRRVRRFRTYMTGELYRALREATILGRAMSGEDEDPSAFADGVARGAAEGDLSGKLFSVRARSLLDGLSARAAPSYLSGLLIGAELADGRRAFGDRPTPIVAGAPALVERYVRAGEVLGHPLSRGPEDAAARGLAALVRTFFSARGRCFEDAIAR